MTKTPAKKTTKTAAKDLRPELEGLIVAVETAGLRLGRHPQLVAALERAKAAVAAPEALEQGE